jgi:transketolase
MAAQQLLDAQGVPVRVVSLPSSTVFDRQPREWRESVLRHGLPRIGIEAGVTRWWGQYGCVAALGVDSFGESAPGAQLYEHFGLTAQRLAEEVASCVKSPRALA